MKTDRYLIYQWTNTETELDIDWPRVHQLLGSDCVRWVNQLTLDQCQLIVEQQDHHCCLAAEFYDSTVYQEFLLRKL